MMRRVRLEVARSHEFPEGSNEHGYEMVLPLTPEGRLDREEWAKRRADAAIRRFWGAAESRGRLKHDRRGWSLDFVPGTADDEVIFKGDEHRFVAGEYVSIKEQDGVTRTFRVAEVR